MLTGVHIACVHEFPAVVGPERFACEFDLMFNDAWTPAHLTGGKNNLYKDIALALKGAEWRFPGLVAVASKLASSAGEHTSAAVQIPHSYEAKAGPNPWRDIPLEEAQALPPATGTHQGGASNDIVPPPSAPLVVADPVNERGSLVLEDGATFAQAVAVRNTAQANPQQGAGIVEGVANHIRGIFVSSRSGSADASASASQATPPAVSALATDHADLQA
jgi:hypothetical protein